MEEKQNKCCLECIFNDNGKCKIDGSKLEGDQTQQGCGDFEEKK